MTLQKSVHHKPRVLVTDGEPSGPHKVGLLLANELPEVLLHSGWIPTSGINLLGH